MYDISERDSFEHVTRWLSDVERYAMDGVTTMVVGNKVS